MRKPQVILRVSTRGQLKKLLFEVQGIVLINPLSPQIILLQDSCPLRQRHFLNHDLHQCLMIAAQFVEFAPKIDAHFTIN